MKNYCLLVLIISLLTTQLGYAAANYSCIEESKTIVEIRMCGNKLVPPLEKKVEKEFNRLSKKYKDSPDMQTMIRLTKNSWDNYRNLICVFEESASRGEDTRLPFSLEANRAKVSCLVRTLKEMESVLVKY